MRSQNARNLNLNLRRHLWRFSHSPWPSRSSGSASQGKVRALCTLIEDLAELFVRHAESCIWQISRHHAWEMHPGKTRCAHISLVCQITRRRIILAKSACPGYLVYVFAPWSKSTLHISCAYEEMTRLRQNRAIGD